jgi:hypothetical protein
VQVSNVIVQPRGPFVGCVQAGVFLARFPPGYSLSDRVIHRGGTGLAV